jgi:hypothetical protein
VKYRLEATRAPADAEAEMVVPHSLGLTCKTTDMLAREFKAAQSHLRRRFSTRNRERRFSLPVRSCP